MAAYLWDRVTGKTERVDVSDTGEGGNGDAQGCYGVSAGGRYVIFSSKASNIAPGFPSPPPMPQPYLYLRDRQLGTTRSPNFDPSGNPAYTPNPYTGPPFSPYVSMSDDGSLVVFNSNGNLIPGVTNPTQYDIYLWDPAARFYDLPSQEWAFPAIEACVKAGIVGGYPDGTYHPIEVVNRAQMAVFITRALAGGDAKVPAGPTTAHFPDVPTSHWAYKYIQYAYADNIVAGYADGYEPNTNVTRDQMAVFIARSIVSPTGDAA